MVELVEWLRAQLDEDERIARAAQRQPGGGEWAARADASGIVAVEGLPVCAGAPIPVVLHPDEDETAVHVAEHDPARVLREIDAKRQVLKAYDKAVQTVEELSAVRDRLHARGQDLFMTEMELESAIHRRDTLSGVLRLLALPYADRRPGYRDDWRP